ncbi:MAG: RNA polymerase sporulation sigma factor SigK [Erysipelotrichales bacterium]|nr:RNA polymerase sporulation sigma factor SigK [Erysipelotrichales bacterium]
MNFLFNLLFDLKFFVGFINNGVFKSKLSDEEEEFWIERLFNKDTHEEARVVLIEHNLRLVAHITKKYDNVDESSDDLISIGTIGLIKAIDTYSPDKKVKLATYAARCIENEVLMCIRANKKYSRDVSIYEPIGTDKDGTEITMIETLGDENYSIPDDLDKAHNIECLKEYLKVLDERELMIITLRYGLEGNKELTQREIAKQYKISRSYVSRIEKRALTKLLTEFKLRSK